MRRCRIKLRKGEIGGSSATWKRPFFAVSVLFLFLSSLFFPAFAQAADRAKAEVLEGETIVLIRENNLDSAITKIRESISADASYAPAYVQLGFLFLEKNSLDEAMRSFEKALKLNPGSHTAKTGIGIIFSRKGDLNAAEAALKEALVLNPDPVRTHYELGIVYEKLGQTDKAIGEFKDGIDKFRQGRK